MILRIFTLLAFAIASPLLSQTYLNASGFQTLEELIKVCPATEPCVVTVDAPQQIFLTHDLRLPATLHLLFTAGGRWTVHGATLDFADAHVDAGPTQIFAGDASIRNLAYDRPEWFAEAVNGVYPPTALASAYNSTVPNGTILLQSARYISPFTAAPGSPHLLYDSPRLFIGTATPHPDNETDPTHLVTGSIIVGELLGSAAFRAVNLGIDDGPEAANDFEGYRGFGLVIESGGVPGTVSGSRLKDISVLTTGVVDQHSVMFQGQRDLVIDGLSLWTRGGVHGLVIKSYDVTIRNFHCKGASSDCLIIKSDYATDHQGYSANVRLSDVFIDYLQTPGDTGGIYVDSRWDAVHSVAFTRLHEDGVTAGIVASG